MAAAIISSHPPPLGPAPYHYTLTSYGDPGDPGSSGTPACGGKVVNGAWYYSTGAYSFGCNSKLRLRANGKCVVVKVVDNGPADWVESKVQAKCGGTGYVIDARGGPAQPRAALGGGRLLDDGPDPAGWPVDSCAAAAAGPAPPWLRSSLTGRTPPGPW